MTKQERCKQCPYSKKEYNGEAYFPLYLEQTCIDCMERRYAEWESSMRKVNTTSVSIIGS